MSRRNPYGRLDVRQHFAAERVARRNVPNLNAAERLPDLPTFS